MSNFQKRTKRAWEENEYDKINAQKRQYPLVEQECYFKQAEPMFDAAKLREAYDYFISKRGDFCHAEEIFNYLYCLERDVSLVNQRKQP